VKVFRFGVEAAAVQRAVNACGWQERVLQVDAIGQADLLIAVKDTAGGKHQNLTQVSCISEAGSMVVSAMHCLHVTAVLCKDLSVKGACFVQFFLPAALEQQQ
jgi:hypothetical protein